MGNHDYKKMGHSFTSSISSLPARNYPNVRLLMEPENIIFTNKSGQRANLFMIPYRDKRMYDGQNQKDIVDSFNDHVKMMFSEIDQSLPTCVVGHNFFFRGNYFDFGGAEVLLYPESVSNADIVVMGHLHEFSIFRKSSPKCFYSGSMEKTNFGDASVDKYFIEFDFLSKEERIIKSEVRSLLDLTIDLTEETSSTYMEPLKSFILKQQLSDAIVRLKVKIRENLSGAINKSEIEKLLYSGGSFYVSKVSTDLIQSKAIKNEDILIHKNDFDLFSAYAKTQGLPDEMLKEILEESRSIIQ